MASKEPFLPLSTEDDLENPKYNLQPPVPSAVNYNSNSSSQQPQSMQPMSSITGGSNANFAVAQPMALDTNNNHDDYFPDSSNRHLLCCNCCCDFRRAVLIVNGISIGLKLLAMFGVAIGFSYIDKNLDDIENDLSDDNVRKQVDEWFKSGLATWIEAGAEILLVSMVGLHACGIYGALQFKKWGVLVAGITFAVELVVALISMDLGSIVLQASFLYPHFFMYQLMVAGIMNEVNYHKIASCCGERHM